MPMLNAKRLLPLAIAFLPVTVSVNANAIDFQLGELNGRFSSNLSIGSSWRANSVDQSLISQVNGGTSLTNSGAYDDAYLNYARGDAFSQIIKGVHELSLEGEKGGVFLRGKYWYDYALKERNVPHGHLINGYQANSPLDEDGLNDLAAFSGIELLDAYLFRDFEVNQQAASIRLGRQVINWGESTFVPGGINSISPFDLSAFRRPGAEIKEALLPANMAFASLDLNDNLSLEGFYQITWEGTVIDACGTYFAKTDFAAQGCDGIRIATPTIPATLANDPTYFNAPALAPLVVRRDSNGHREPDDSGQFGLALRYYAEQLNDTEFGLYFANYHSRLPLISGINTAGAPNAPFDSRYYITYPEDTKLLGLSFSTTVDEWAISGELSHKQDVPVQLNGPLMVSAMLTQFSGGSGNSGADTLVAAAGLNGNIQGYSLFDISQAQATLIRFYNNVLGASRMTVAGELAWTHIHNFSEDANALKYGRAGEYGYSSGDNDGFVTQDSYGYVIRASLLYPDALNGINLTPTLTFRHGLEGYSPQPGGIFNEDEKQLSLSLLGSFRNQYQAELSYTNYFGGEYNHFANRDYLSLSFSVAF